MDKGNECLSPLLEKIKSNGYISSEHSSHIENKQNTPCDESPCNNLVPPASDGEDKVQCKSKYFNCSSSTPIKYVQRTPPSRNRGLIVANPFEVGITERLHLPVCSPSVFAQVVNPSQDSSSPFKWTVEELSRLCPADIEEFPSHQYEETVDPETESKAQEAIQRYFFSKNRQLLPSPWNTRTDAMSLRQENNGVTPSHFFLPGEQVYASDDDDDDCGVSSKPPGRDVWTQTTLTLPPILPPSMELALKPFFTFTQDQQQAQQDSKQGENTVDSEEVLSTSTLRRKLFCNSDLSESPSPSVPLKSVEFPRVVVNGVSHSLIHIQDQGRTFGTPLGPAHCHSSPSPPDISPVQSGLTPIRRVKSATRLDFSQEDMALDSSIGNPPSTPRQAICLPADACSPLGTAPLHDKETQDDGPDHSRSSAKWTRRTKLSTMDCSASTPVKAGHLGNLSNAQTSMMDISQEKSASQVDIWRDEDIGYQQEVTNFSYSQQAVSSNVLSHDTGYATNSVTFQSNTTSMFGLSLMRDKMGYEDSLAVWPINPNVVSSTPTKSHVKPASEYQQNV